MSLVKIVDGHAFTSSVAELKRDFPHVSFPKDLSSVNLSQYGYANTGVEGVAVTRESYVSRVAMHQFLYAIRDFGFREQFERYTLALDGHARDYWFTAPYVNKDHVCVKHMAAFFQLTGPDLDTIFSVAGSIEE